MHANISFGCGWTSVFYDERHESNNNLNKNQLKSWWRSSSSRHSMQVFKVCSWTSTQFWCLNGFVRIRKVSTTTHLIQFPDFPILSKDMLISKKQNMLHTEKVKSIKPDMDRLRRRKERATALCQQNMSPTHPPLSLSVIGTHTPDCDWQGLLIRKWLLKRVLKRKRSKRRLVPDVVTEAGPHCWIQYAIEP